MFQRVTGLRQAIRDERDQSARTGCSDSTGGGGYVLQATVAKALTLLAESQIESHQGAFTWTGPYGGGKSSAPLLLANLVAGGRANRKIARELAGPALTELYNRAFPKSVGDWNVVAVSPVQ